MSRVFHPHETPCALQKRNDFCNKQLSPSGILCQTTSDSTNQYLNQKRRIVPMHTSMSIIPPKGPKEAACSWAGIRIWNCLDICSKHLKVGHHGPLLRPKGDFGVWNNYDQLHSLVFKRETWYHLPAHEATRMHSTALPNLAASSRQITICTEKRLGIYTNYRWAHQPPSSSVLLLMYSSNVYFSDLWRS